MLIAGTPKDLMTTEDIEEYGNVSNWITAQLNEIEEDLQYSLKKSGKLEVLGDMLYEWEDDFNLNNDSTTIYDSVNFSNGDSPDIVFPYEKFNDEDNNKLAISIGFKEPTATSIEELLDDGMKNIDMLQKYRDLTENLVCTMIDNKIFVTYTGQWLFKNEFLALDAIKHRLNVSLYPYSHLNFIEKHPEFFESICKYLDEDEAKRLKDYIANTNTLGTILSESFSDFYNLITKGFDNLLLSKIKFMKIKDIAK